MPLQRYQALEPGRCPYCREGFDHVALAEEVLQVCPRCGGPVSVVQASVSVPRVTRPIGNVEAKDVGFKVYERNTHGLYEQR